MGQASRAGWSRFGRSRWASFPATWICAEPGQVQTGGRLALFWHLVQGIEKGGCPVGHTVFADTPPHRAHPAPGLLGETVAAPTMASFRHSMSCGLTRNALPSSSALAGPAEPGMGAVGGFPATRRSPLAQVGTAAGSRLVRGVGRSCGSSLVNPSQMRARRTVLVRPISTMAPMSATPSDEPSCCPVYWSPPASLRPDSPLGGGPVHHALGQGPGGGLSRDRHPLPPPAPVPARPVARRRAERAQAGSHRAVRAAGHHAQRPGTNRREPGTRGTLGTAAADPLTPT